MTLTTFLRPAAILAAALSLAACGGKASFPINGTAYNVIYGGLVISANGADLAIPAQAAGATSQKFSFPNTLSYGDTYTLSLKTQPAHQSCNFNDPVTGRDTTTDTAGRLAAINVAVSCSINTFTIGGTVSNLTAGPLVLTNGSADTVTIPAGATSYVFPSSVPYNLSYGVTVLTQPTGVTCTVANGTGVVGDANVTNINITCA